MQIDAVPLVQSHPVEKRATVFSTFLANLFSKLVIWNPITQPENWIRHEHYD